MRKPVAMTLATVAIVALAAGTGAAPPWRQPAVTSKASPIPVRKEQSGSVGPAKPYSVPGLDLDPPQRKTRVGLAYVVAKVTATPSAKVKIKWKIEQVWDDAIDPIEWEIRDSGTRLQVSLPDCSGVIRVTVLAVIDGEPTDFAETLVEMEYTPRTHKSAKTIAAAPVAVVDGKVAEVVFIVQPDADPNLDALIVNVGLLNKLKALGIKRLVFEDGSAAVVRNGLDTAVKEVGAPAMVLRTAGKEIVRTVKCPVTETGILAEIQK